VVWFGPARLLVTAFAVLAVVAGGTWLLKGSPSRAEDALPFATRATSTTVSPVTSPTTTVATSIVVYVAGAVAAPGVYTLSPSARVNDAVIAAGGPATGADLGVVNLAATLKDGERVYVPAVGEVVRPSIEVAPAAPDTSPAELVNINVATADQLDVLPGVGPATAAAIVAHRQQHGPFQSIEQLGDVRGIGAAKLDALRGLVTV
jgi:competence protein ComEA